MSRTTRLAAVVTAGLLAGVVVAGAVLAARPDEAPSPARPPAAGPGSTPPQGEAGSCSGSIPVSPSYLPQGFDATERPGPAPGAPAADPAGDRPAQAVVHFTDGERSVEIRRPGTEFVERAQGEGARTITVLGADVSDVAPVAPRTEDLIVQFSFPPGSGDDPCARYSVDGYGLTEAELRRVAEGLVPAG